MINYKFWTKDAEHKKWLLSQYQKNEESRRNIETKELFKNTTDKKYENKTIENKELVVIKKENIFRRIINFIKSIVKYE